MNSDLFLSILAMDSYNRGYGQGVGGLSSGGSLGNAVISRQSDVRDGSAEVNAGFYAIAYNVGGVAGFSPGQTVISYRGTDVIGGLNGDLLNGWTLGGNLPNQSQGKLGIDFYNAVVSHSVFDSAGAKPILTGHSLGGGLAGFIGTLAGTRTLGLDHMPFLDATLAAFMTEFRKRAIDHNKPVDSLPTDELLVEFGMQRPNFGNWTGVALEGEINRLLRDGSIALTLGGLLGGLSLAIPYVGSFVATLFAATGGWVAGGQIAGEQALGSRNSVIGTFDWGKNYDYLLNGVDRHSVATLVLLKFVDDAGQTYSGWSGAADALLDALYDNRIAIAAGADSIRGKSFDNSDFASILRTTLTYSAIDAGTKPFGDTGIRALFNDADQLGTALSYPDRSTSIQAVASSLSLIFTQYAGRLAINKVTGMSSAAIDGVLTLSGDGQTLSVDFAQSVWNRSNGDGTTTGTDIVGRKDLTDRALSSLAIGAIDAGGNITLASDVRAGLKWLYGDDDSSVVDKVNFQTHETAWTTILSPRGTGATPGKVTLTVAAGSNDAITGSIDNDFIAGGAGNDTIAGGAGDDLIAGNSGNDTLSGGAGRDFIAGGSGFDTIDLGLGAATGGQSLALVANAPSSAEQRGSFSLTINGDTDRAVDVEAIRMTNYSDILTVSDLGSMNVLYPSALSQLKVDLGSSPFARDVDVADFSSAGRTLVDNALLTEKVGVHVDLGDTNNQTVNFYYSTSVPLLPTNHSTNLLQDELLLANVNTVIGTANDDYIRGNGGRAADNEGFSTLRGGAGNDTLVAAGWETHLYGGAGRDTFETGAGAIIDESDAADKTLWCGIQLYGGVNPFWGETGVARWAPYTTLINLIPTIGAQILTAGATFIDKVTMKFASYKLFEDGNLGLNFGWGQINPGLMLAYDLALDTGLGSGGITAFALYRSDGRQTTIGVVETAIGLALKAGFGVMLGGGFDPLVLDLDGDGYELATETNGKVYFEFDSDGFGEHSGWVRGDDGFLVRDLNANGLIDTITEMFGNRTTPGFTALGTLDTNADGKVSAADSGFASLKIWQDLDQDGVTDAGELKTLSQLGIVSIGLANVAPATPTSIGGNTIARTGSFTRSDGTTGGIADVALMISETDSRWLGSTTVSTAAAALPQLAGFGEVKDLRVAMTGDATLKGLVTSFVGNTSTDLATLKAAAETILYRWAGVQGTATTALGSNGFTRRRLAFLEKYSGYQLMPRDAGGNVQLTNIAQMEALWADQVTRLTLRLVVQGPLASQFSTIRYDAARDLMIANGPTALADLLRTRVQALPTGASAAQAEWAAWAPLLGALSDGMVRADGNVVHGDYLFAQLVRALDGLTPPLSLAQLASGLNIANMRIGTSGNDTLARGTATDTAVYYGGGGDDAFTGGTGQDAYVFGRTIGHAVITDIENNPAGDRIRFAFLNQSDVKLTRSGDDLLITVTATSESVRVTGQFAAVIPLGSDVLLSTDKGVEDIQFADGSIMEIPEIMTAVGTGTAGNDQLTGTMHSDVLIGGLGNDRLEGGDDADLYVVRAGEGQDVIRDVQTTPLLRAADLLVFGDGLAPEDVTLSRTGATNDDLLIATGGGNTVLIEGQFGYTSLGYNASLAPNGRIEAFAFKAYADSWSNRDVETRLIEQGTSAGADSTRGFGNDDDFAMSAGNDLLIGMDGQDAYHWGAGAGNDTIDEQSRFIDINVGLGGLSLGVAADTVHFTDDVLPSDIVFSRATSAPDLTITLTATGETLTVRNQFAGFQTGPLGAQWFDRVEWFAFTDGSAFSWQDVLAKITTGGVGNDMLTGDLYADTLRGNGGNDTLAGKGYGDLYKFSLGDGQDIIQDANQFTLGEGFVTLDELPDTLEFGAGILPGDIRFEHVGGDIKLIVGNGGDSVLLKGQDSYLQTGVFGAISWDRIETIKFANGVTWSWDELNRRVIAAGTTSGNDVVTGFTFEDRFEASAGDDILSGGESSDTYVFGRTSGRDEIRESVSNVLYDDDDVVEFAPEIAPADLILTRSGNDLLIAIAGSTATLKITSEFDNYVDYTWNDIERFRFTNTTTPTIWTKAEVQVRLLASTPGNDVLTGFHTADDLGGGLGNDILRGADGSDSYRFNRDDGQDRIEESVRFANIDDNDRLVFGAGIAPADVTLARSGNDLVLGLQGSSDTITIAGQYDQIAWFTWTDVERFEFTSYPGTVWTKDEVAARLLGGTPGPDTLLGTSGNDRLDGGLGNDTLQGVDGSDTYVFGRGYGDDLIVETVNNANVNDDDRLVFNAGVSPSDLVYARNGNDLIITITGTTDRVTISGEFSYVAYFTWSDVERFEFADSSFLTKEAVIAKLVAGTAGNDHIVGFASDDQFDGGAGNDIIEGADGADTYAFGLGDGQDTIIETAPNANLSDNDTLVFKAGITPGNVTVTRIGQDAIFTIASGESVRVVGQFNEGYNESYTANDVERVTFADGTVWDKVFIARAALHPTAGDDIINATWYDEAITGLAGNDTIYARGGNDDLTGGTGNDRLEGEAGDDRYFYNAGDGDDTIYDYAFWGNGTNRLVLGGGIVPGDLRFAGNSAEPSEMTISFANRAGSIRVLTQWFEDTGINAIDFAGGVSWTTADIAAAFVAGQATAANDTIFGTPFADIIDGGLGNDLLKGERGDDIYRFGRGGGSDVILDQGPIRFYGPENGGIDRVELGAGVLPSDVGVFTTDNGTSLVLAIRGTDDTLTMSNAVAYDGNRIESVIFADTTVWSYSNLIARAVTGFSAADDAIVGTSAGDFMRGGAGNDAIEGLGGNDEIEGNADNDNVDGGSGDDILRGDTGNDVLVGNTGNDTLVGGSGSDVLIGDALPLTITTGANLIANGSFETSGTGVVSNNWGISNATLPGWTKTNSQPFQQVNSGENGVLAGNGAYWLDLHADGGPGSNMAISQSVTGLAAGERLSLSFDHANQTNITSGTFEVRWNGAVIASYADSTRLMQTASFDMTAISGTNTLEFRGLGPEDNVGAAIDTVKLYRTTTIVPSGSNLIVNGSFETIGATAYSDNWGRASATAPGWVKANTGAYEQNYSGVDGVNASNGRYWMDMDAGGGAGSNLDISQTVAGLSAGQTMLLQFDHANRRSAASGSFDVYWNGALVMSVTDVGTTMRTEALRVTAIAGNNILRFAATGAADAFGASLDNVRLSATGAFAGNDVLDGGDGDDVFRIGGTTGADAITGGLGNDTLEAIGNNMVIGLSAIGGVETVTAGSYTGVSIAGTAANDVLDFSGATMTGIVRIDGGAGNDTITGSLSADVIVGSTGDDSLTGGAGNDRFEYAGTSGGFDTVVGGSGSDTVAATANSTTIGLTAISGVEAVTGGGFTGVAIAGSANADVLDFTGATMTGITKIDGGAGNDTITGSASADTIVGGTGDDILSGGDGNDVFQVSGSTGGFDAVDGGLGNDTISALANNSVIGLVSVANVEAISAGSFTGVSIAGSANPDTLNLTGTTLTAITRIDGGAGNDAVTGTAAADIILGGAGDDTLDGAMGDDVFQFSGTASGYDAIDGGTGNDTVVALANSTIIGLRGLANVEAISGGSFTGVSIAGSGNADILNFSTVTLTAIGKIDGGAGDDVITGTGVADTLVGSGGNDTLAGSAGNDVFQYTGTTNGADVVDGGAGTDTISALANSTVIGLSSLTGVETISAASFTGVYIAGSANADTLDFSGVTLTAITKIDAGLGNDVVTGSAGADTLWGNDGNDTLSGAAGNDTLKGDNNDDVLSGGAGNDVIDGGAGIDTVDYSYASANLTVSLALTTAQTVATGDADTITNVEKLIGGSGADTLTGSTAANMITGGGGNDRITGGLGNDILDGGLGADVAVFAGLQASYSLATVAGTTTIVDNQTTTDGNDGTDTLVGIETAEFKGGVQVGIGGPIVLDLDGDGAELIGRGTSTTRFDWTGDGRSERTGWVSGDDAILVYDRDHDGRVTSANELSFTSDKAGAKSDLDGLSAFDSNGDGAFSSADAAWQGFGAWQDRNGNGSVDTGELRSLADVGITSISLGGVAVDRRWGWDENLTINTGNFTRSDGSTGRLADVALLYDIERSQGDGRTRPGPIRQGNSDGPFDEAIRSYSTPRKRVAESFGPDEDMRARNRLLGNSDEVGAGSGAANAAALRLAHALSGFGATSAFSPIGLQARREESAAVIAAGHLRGALDTRTQLL